MKTIKLFMMAALAVMTAACSSDDNDITTPTPQPVKPEGIPFSATIESESATTRTLTESGTTITAAWKTGEKVALIYTVNDTKQLVVAEVTANTDHSATIKATLTGSPADGTPVEIVYPASAVDETTKEMKDRPTLLVKQTGSLPDISTNYDLREATGKLKIGEETASLQESVRLNSELAILYIQAIKPYNSNVTLAFNSLTITIDGKKYVNIEKQSGSGQNSFYVALPPVSNGKVIFLAKDVDGNTYGYSKSGVTFEAGKYYQSTLKMMGAFSVGADKRVCFSQGNLQYNGSTWQFAENQWNNLSFDCAGTAGSTADLFTWGNISSPKADGTSYDTFSSNLDNTKAPGAANTATGSDWGYNAISNGGNKNSQWRTLTIDEWNYLFKTRTNATSKYGFATVNDIHGIIIVPDGFSDPNKNNGSNAFAGSSTTGWDANIYKEANWTSMEEAGCVFLPAGGYRNVQSVTSHSSSGYYWSASCGGSTTYAQYLEFNGSSLNIHTTWTGDANKQLGYSVRLVRDL